MSISSITSNPTLNQTTQTLQQDFQNLGTALQSGNITTAQQSFAQLLQDKQNVNQTQRTTPSQVHHHHHHHATGTQQASASQTSQTTSSQDSVQNVLTSALAGVSQSQNSTSTTS